MSRKPKETLAVQLFPFLAVLVCTMGSLIFLLLVTTRQIRQRAVAVAAHELARPALVDAAPLLAIPAPAPAPEPAAPPTMIVLPPQPSVEAQAAKRVKEEYLQAIAERQEELDQLASKWKLRIEQLQGERESHADAITRQKELLGRTVAATGAIQAEIDKLELQLGKLSGEVATTSIQAQDDAARARLEQQIAELKRKLRAVEEAEKSDHEKFQIVPFDPVTGTTRRPIFIECSEAGIRFLPEGITISPADLAGFTNRINPLAAGTGALINYWNAWNLQPKHAGSESDPYVLLLVRPNGIVAYYIALNMLSPIRTPHGYELIDESTELQLPPVDAGAKAACQAAIERLLAERETIYRSAMRDGSGDQVFGGNLRGVPGGSTTERLVGARKAEGGGFLMSDVTGDDNPSREERSWENVDKFKGRPRGGGGANIAGTGGGSPDSGEFSAGERPASGRKGTAAGTGAAEDGETPPSLLGGMIGRGGKAGRRQGGGEPIPPGGGVAEMPVGERPGKKKTAWEQAGTANGDAASDEDVPEEVASGTDGGPSEFSAERSSRNSPSRLKLSSDSRDRKSRDATLTKIDPEMLSGRRWGFSDAGASIGFEREVRVDVQEDKFIVAQKYNVPVEKGASKDEVFEDFVTTLDRHSHEWGRPPQGFFWTPRLKFVVKPEANANYEMLNSMMERAGIASSHELSRDKSRVEFGREPPSPTKPAAAGAKPAPVKNATPVSKAGLKPSAPVSAGGAP